MKHHNLKSIGGLKVERQYSIYDLLAIIRKRPGMYIGEITLNNLFNYISGYRAAMDIAGIEDISIPEFYDFHEFVKEQYGYRESTAGWANMILAVTIGLNPSEIIWENYDSNITSEQHKTSVDRFFQLIDAYRLGV